MAHLDRLLDTLRVGLPGAIESVIRLSLFNAVQEFARETFAFYEDVTLDLIDGIDEYDTAELTPNEVKTVLAVQVDDRPIAATPLPLVRSTDSAKTSCWSVLPPSTIVLSPAPTAPLPVIIARVATVPLGSEDADPLDNIPDWYFDKFFGAFEAGTLSKMLGQVAKPYTNVQLALFYQRRFLSEKTKASDTAMNGFTPAQSPTWRFPRFA